MNAAQAMISEREDRPRWCVLAAPIPSRIEMWARREGRRTSSGLTRTRRVTVW